MCAELIPLRVAGSWSLQRLAPSGRRDTPWISRPSVRGQIQTHTEGRLNCGRWEEAGAPSNSPSRRRGIHSNLYQELCFSEVPIDLFISYLSHGDSDITCNNDPETVLLTFLKGNFSIYTSRCVYGSWEVRLRPVCVCGICCCCCCCCIGANCMKPAVAPEGAVQKIKNKKR